MKKITSILLAAVALLSSVTASAQGKYGADSAECIKYLSYYQEYYKQKNYAEAIPSWRKAYQICPPTANQNMLLNGTTLLREQIRKNSNNVIYRNALIDSLLTLHDVRAEYYPKYQVITLNNKAQDIVKYLAPIDDERTYNECKAIVEVLKNQVKPIACLFELKAAVELYKIGKLDAETIISDYQTLSEIVVAAEAAEPDENTTQIRTDMESLFISSQVASCENLVSLFTPRYEAAPDDLELAKNIVKMMNATNEDCTDNDLYLKAVNTTYKLEPNHSSAYYLSKLYAGKADYATAVKYLEEALGYEDVDAASQAKYNYELAVNAFKDRQNAKSYNAALKAVELDESYKGKSYLLCGTIWGSISGGSDYVEKREHFWVAVDYRQKAKAADESLTETANGYIAQYARNFPDKVEAFMVNFDKPEGTGIVVSCAGLSCSTTVRYAK